MLASFTPLLMLAFFGVTASVGLIGAALFMGTPVDPILVVTFGMIVFCVYGINRFTDVEDLLNDPQKRLFFQKNKYLLGVVVTLLTASLVSLYLTNRLTVVHLLIVVVGTFYSVGLIPPLRKGGAAKLLRLKDITFLKSLSVTITLGSAFFAINWLVYPQAVADPLKVSLVIISCMLVVFVNTNFCDIRDVDGDRASGVPTIPARFGVARTVLFGMALPTLVWLAVVAALAAIGTIGPVLGVFFLLNAAYPVVYLGAHFRSTMNRRLVSLTADASVLLFAFGLVALHLVEKIA
jgi:4-hydroxybenzoate polyprenyltransferase